MPRLLLNDDAKLIKHQRTMGTSNQRGRNEMMLWKPKNSEPRTNPMEVAVTLE